MKKRYYKKDDNYYCIRIMPDNIDDIYKYDNGFNLHLYDTKEVITLEENPETLNELIEDCRGFFDEKALKDFAEENLANLFWKDSFAEVIEKRNFTTDDIIDFMISCSPSDLGSRPSFYSLFTPDMPVRYVEPIGFYRNEIEFGEERAFSSDYSGHIYILKNDTEDVPDDKLQLSIKGQKKELKAYCNGEVYSISVNCQEASDGTEGGIFGLSDEVNGILGSDELDEIIAYYVGEDATEIDEKEYLSATRF